MPSNGVVDLYTYAGGRTPQALGIPRHVRGRLARAVAVRRDQDRRRDDGRRHGLQSEVVRRDRDRRRGRYGYGLLRERDGQRDHDQQRHGRYDRRRDDEGQEVIDYILTSSDTNAVKARALVQPTISVRVRASSPRLRRQGAPNGGLAATPLVEG